MLEKKGSAHTTDLKNVFPKTAVMKFHSLLIKYAEGMSVGGSEYKVKLSSSPSNAFERSSCSDEKCTPRIDCDLIRKHLQTKIC